MAPRSSSGRSSSRTSRSLVATTSRSAGGEEGLRRHQGFYVYRGRRLITFGTWFRLLRQGELTKLARVQIDIPNTLDHLWALDVKKSTAFPPEAVRAGLLTTIERIGGESRQRVHLPGRARQPAGYPADVAPRRCPRRVQLRDQPSTTPSSSRRRGTGRRQGRQARAAAAGRRDGSARRQHLRRHGLRPGRPAGAASADEAEAMLFDLASRLVDAVAGMPDARGRLLGRRPAPDRPLREQPGGHEESRSRGCAVNTDAMAEIRVGRYGRPTEDRPPHRGAAPTTRGGFPRRLSG